MLNSNFVPRVLSFRAVLVAMLAFFSVRADPITLDFASNLEVALKEEKKFEAGTVTFKKDSKKIELDSKELKLRIFQTLFWLNDNFKFTTELEPTAEANSQSYLQVELTANAKENLENAFEAVISGKAVGATEEAGGNQKNTEKIDLGATCEIINNTIVVKEENALQVETAAVEGGSTKQSIKVAKPDLFSEKKIELECTWAVNDTNFSEVKIDGEELKKLKTTIVLSLAGLKFENEAFEVTSNTAKLKFKSDSKIEVTEFKKSDGSSDGKSAEKSDGSSDGKSDGKSAEKSAEKSDGSSAGKSTDKKQPKYLLWGGIPVVLVLLIGIGVYMMKRK